MHKTNKEVILLSPSRHLFLHVLVCVCTERRPAHQSLVCCLLHTFHVCCPVLVLTRDVLVWKKGVHASAWVCVEVPLCSPLFTHYSTLVILLDCPTGWVPSPEFILDSKGVQTSPGTPSWSYILCVSVRKCASIHSREGEARTEHEGWASVFVTHYACFCVLLSRRRHDNYKFVSIHFNNQMKIIKIQILPLGFSFLMQIRLLVLNQWWQNLHFRV